MKDKNNQNNFQEHRNDIHNLTADSHVKEDTENMKRKKWDNYCLNDKSYYILEIVETFFKCCSINIGKSESDSERQKQCCHYIHNRRHCDGKIGLQHEILWILNCRKLGVDRQYLRKNVHSAEISEKTGEYG